MTDDKVFGDYNLMSNFIFKGYFFIETKAEIFQHQNLEAHEHSRWRCTQCGRRVSAGTSSGHFIKDPKLLSLPRKMP